MFLISYIVLRDYVWHSIFFIDKLRNEEWLWGRINRPITCIFIVSQVALLAESLRRLYSSSQPPIKTLDVPFDGMSVLLGNVRRGSTGYCNRLVCTVQPEWKQAGVSAASPLQPVTATQTALRLRPVWSAVMRSVLCCQVLRFRKDGIEYWFIEHIDGLVFIVRRHNVQFL